MFIAALFIIAKRWKQPKCPSMDEWINETCYSHKMEHYSVKKRNEVPIHTTTMNELWKYYGKFRKLGTKPYDFIYIKCPE